MLTEGVVLPVKALQRKAAGGGEDSARRSCSGLRAPLGIKCPAMIYESKFELTLHLNGLSQYQNEKCFQIDFGPIMFILPHTLSSHNKSFFCSICYIPTYSMTCT